MHQGMHTFPQERPRRERSEIPVDNSQFSTFSTDFSTGVFHSPGGLWIFIFGSHKKPRRNSPKFPLFRGSLFLPQGIFCAEKQDLTRRRVAADSLLRTAQSACPSCAARPETRYGNVEGSLQFQTLGAMGSESSGAGQCDSFPAVRNALPAGASPQKKLKKGVDFV